MPNEELSTDIEQNQIEENLQDQDKTETEITNKEEIEQISTLYSLSADIDDSCDEFCELKTRLTNAIIETQNLIQKVQTEQIELTPEQRMLITEQSKQLKELGRQLSFATTDLSVNLSDLNQLMRDGNGNLDALSLKYLVVLDNLVNGNEMLANGLNSLNLINQMFYMNSNMPGNNQGRILYGFRRNNEPPVVKDYIIDENGQMIENNQNQEQTELVNQNEETLADESNKNIDTYNQPLLKSNIDTFGNTRNNIDTFFNTAWLDNNFMYGNGGYPYGMGMHNGYYPYVQNRQNFNNFANTTESVNNDNNTQYTPKQTKKKFKLKKNVDTYKDENTPTVSAKITTIKNNISNFFNKFSKKEKKVENPVYKYE
ncbi:MAG: hypothetical protein IKM43_03075 [Clostridia bacterium]|nr:hypothetical protein [Clostridia bacterium]